MTLCKSFARAAAIWTAIALIAAPAAAQAPAKPDSNDPDAVLVEELVVMGRLPGPAWWRVQTADGASTVYVLGAPSLAPKHMAWDQGVFQRRLAGAHEVILPFSGPRVHLMGAPGAFFGYLRLRSSRPFEESLDPATRARFAAARARVGQPADRYKLNNALAAALELLNDYRDHEGLTTTDPSKLIKLLAQRAKVPVKQKAYDLGPLIGAASRTPAAAARACLDDALAVVEAGPGGIHAAAKAWAGGDTLGALGAERSYEKCLAAAPGALAFDARTKADEVEAIEDALKTPGHAIAVVQLRPLLAQGGVLDRLRGAGYVVKTPGEE
jgi:hypothetical protein